MRRLITALVALCVAATASATNNIVMRAVKSQQAYDGISVGGPIKVYVEERTEGNIIIRATEKTLDALKLKIEGGSLNICFPEGFKIKRKSDFTQAEVYLPYNGKLHEFSAVGCAQIEVKPHIKATEVDIESAAASQISLSSITAEKVNIESVGASSVKTDIDCVKVDVEITGAATVTMSGKATKADFEVVGASSLNASEFISTHLDAEISGASKGKMAAEQASIEVTGASSAEIKCSTILNASAAGASTINYSGDCQVNISNNSGASTIKER